MKQRDLPEKFSLGRTQIAQILKNDNQFWLVTMLTDEVVERK